MTVCKCDRCGKYVDADVIPQIRGYINPFRDRDYSGKNIRMDLCPECYALLREFLGYNDYKHEEDKEEEEEEEEEEE